MTEVNVLGVVEHANLVKLLGYCAEDDERGIQRLLVYEYMPNRSVQDHLSSRFQIALPWGTRMKIAQDAARGLAYLHEGMEFQVISNPWCSYSKDWGVSHRTYTFSLVGWYLLSGIVFVNPSSFPYRNLMAKPQFPCRDQFGLLFAICNMIFK